MALRICDVARGLRETVIQVVELSSFKAYYTLTYDIDSKS